MDSRGTSTRLERIQGCIAAGNYQDGEVFRGVRPKQLSDEPINALSTAATLSIETSGPMGSESLVYYKTGPRQLDCDPSRRLCLFALGEKVAVHFGVDKSTLFDSSTEGVTGELSKSRILDPGPLKALPL